MSSLCRPWITKIPPGRIETVNRLMDQKPIVLYLRMKGMALDAVHDDLVHTLGKDAVAYSTAAKYACSARFSGRKEATLPKLQMWNAVLSMRQYSRLLSNFRFRFRLCASFRGESVFRDPPCTGTGTSCNHFASGCHIFDGSLLFGGGTEVDSGPDGNRTISGPLGAKPAPVARYYHLG
jgi:hypothetical protein